MKHSVRFKVLALTALLPLALMNGCLSGSGDSGLTESPGGGGGTSNRAPTISGNPPTSVRVGEAYSFTPTASDPDGDTLTFSVQNLPSWASFNSSNGRVSGTPTLGNVGSYQNIVITVSDGSLSAALPGFAVAVNQVSMGSATLSWAAPSQNTDGTALTDLSGYKIYYGVSPGSYPNQTPTISAGTTTYVVDNLTPNTYYFVATAFNTSGVESGYSNVATIVVN